MSADGKPWLQTHWDWHVALNFVTGGAGSGLLLAAIAGALAGLPLLVPALLATLLIGAGLAQVSLHLGRPLRALNVLRHPGRSWMSREAWVAGPTLLAGLAAGLSGSLLAALPAALLGGAFLYCQARILTESRGIPAWREPRIVALILATGVVEGAALALLIAQATTHSAALPVLGGLLLLAVIARHVAWGRYRRALAGNAPQAALAVLERSEGAFVGVGHAVPVLLLVVAAALPAARDPLLALAAASALAAGWGLKFVLVTRAGYNQGFAILHTPARGAGPGGTGSKPGW